MVLVPNTFPTAPSPSKIILNCILCTSSSSMSSLFETLGAGPPGDRCDDDMLIYFCNPERFRSKKTSLPEAADFNEAFIAIGMTETC